MVYIGILYNVDFVWDFPIVIGKPIHFGDSWQDLPLPLPSLYHNPSLDLFQIFYTILTSLNARISRGLEQFHRRVLAESAQVTSTAKDDWSRANMQGGVLMLFQTTPHFILTTAQYHRAGGAIYKASVQGLVAKELRCYMAHAQCTSLR